MLKIISFLLFSLLFWACGGGGGGGSTPPTTNDNNTTPPDNNTTKSMKFVVTVPDSTPQDELICLKVDGPDIPFKMTKTGTNQWEINLSNIQTNRYKYARNCEDNMADEEFNTTEKGWRDLQIAYGTIKQDSVIKWRWWNDKYFQLSNDVNQTENGYTNSQPSTLPRSDFMNGIMFNDYWNEQWRDDVNSTLQHAIQNSSAKWIEYAPVNNIKAYYPKPVIEFNGPNGTSEEQLRRIIRMAHKNNLKVFINPIPWGLNVTDNSPSDHNQSWWNDFHDAYKPIMMRYAQIAQEEHVEMLGFKMWPSVDDISSNEQPYMDDLALDLLHDVDNNYTGKVAVTSICYDEDKQSLKVYGDAATDYLAMSIWSYYPWALSKDPDNDNDPGNKDANVSVLKSNFSKHLQSGSYGNVADFASKFSKPVIFAQIALHSYDSAIVEAAPDDESLAPFNENNDSNYVIDLQEQSDAMEAVLSESVKHDYIQGAFIFTYFYWNSIDKDINVRGKPAEKIIKKWFGWIND